MNAPASVACKRGTPPNNGLQPTAGSCRFAGLCEKQASAVTPAAAEHHLTRIEIEYEFSANDICTLFSDLNQETIAELIFEILGENPEASRLVRNRVNELSGNK